MAIEVCASCREIFPAPALSDASASLCPNCRRATVNVPEHLYAEADHAFQRILRDCTEKELQKLIVALHEIKGNGLSAAEAEKELKARSGKFSWLAATMPQGRTEWIAIVTLLVAALALARDLYEQLQNSSPDIGSVACYRNPVGLPHEQPGRDASGTIGRQGDRRESSRRDRVPPFLVARNYLVMPPKSYLEHRFDFGRLSSHDQLWVLFSPVVEEGRSPSYPVNVVPTRLGRKPRQEEYLELETASVRVRLLQRVSGSCWQKNTLGVENVGDLEFAVATHLNGKDSPTRSLILYSDTSRRRQVDRRDKEWNILKGLLWDH